MNTKIKNVNRRFIKQSVFFSAAIIFISFIGIIILNKNSIRNINQWGLRTAEAFMLKHKLFVDEYKYVVNDISNTISYTLEFESDLLKKQKYIENIFKNLKYKKYNIFGHVYIDNKYCSFENYNEYRNERIDEEIWYDLAYKKNGEIIISDVYTDNNGAKKVFISKLLDDGKSVVALELLTEDIVFEQVIYDNEYVSSQTIIDSKGNLVFHKCSEEYDYDNCSFNETYKTNFNDILSKFNDKNGYIELKEDKNDKIKYYVVDENGWTFFIGIHNYVINKTLKNIFISLSIVIFVFIMVVIYLSILNYREAKKVLKIISYFDTIGNTYYSGVVINVKTNICIALKRDINNNSITTKFKDYDSFVSSIIDYIDNEYIKDFVTIFSFDNIKNMLYSNDSSLKTYMEYKGNFRNGSRWFSVEVFPVKNDSVKSELLMLFKEIHNEKVNEIEQKQLLEDSLEIAENAVRAKSDFLSRMSHDMRTPMNAMIGFANVAENNLDDKEKVKDCLLKIVAATKQLLHLVDEILDMAKIEQGKMEINKSEIDIYDFIKDTVDMFKIQCDVQNKKFEFKQNNFKHNILVTDALRLQKIVNNIISNAIKYTNIGGTITFEVVETFVDKKHSYYKFIVTDTGIGMSEKFLEKIFEPFERENTELINQVSGVGLGMAIVKTTVQLLGGSIDVESEVGKGSKFTVIIPCEVKDYLTLQSNNNDVLDVDFNLYGKKFLVVEDNVLNMEIAKELLNIEGIETTLAYNGEEAFNIFVESGENYFDVVLMDIQMPVMNGYEATKKIRKIGSKYSKDIPIIAMTANAFADDIIKATESGMNGHISKPVDYNRLKKMVYDILNNNNSNL